MCGTGSIRTYQLWLIVGSESKLYMFQVLVVWLLNLLVMYLIRFSFARLAIINNNQ